ncbi:MAG: hypothetical protein DSY80_03570 [Desulfocapsa sp.]|nr:MAG: hypothetical protein DSY80_03570 [Desulfocapsa sp.]
MDNIALAKLFETGKTDDPLDEIQFIIGRMSPGFPQAPLIELHRELELLFNGKHPLYRQSNTKYHNLDHTYSVVLATARIFHGLFCDGWPVSDETLNKALYSAYFHDCGLLLKITEEAETGARFTIGHEKRSMFFMADYLQEKGFSMPFITDCSVIIQSTNLGINPDTLFFPSAEMQLASFAVGTADILAQMADRYYLERLPLLFQEFQEGGIDRHSSTLELMRQTSDFYESVVVDRLSQVFGNLVKYMRIHFRERWGVDRSLYLESIKKNLKYNQYILETKKVDMDSLKQYLRRVPPS